MSNILNELNLALRNDNFECFVQDAGEGYPLPRLMVYLGADKKNRERVLEVTLKDQFLTESLKELAEAGETPYFTLEFFCQLPLIVNDYSIAETARIIAFINRSSGFPGFELDEVDGKLCFRYIHMDQRKHWKIEPIKGMIGTILLQLDLFSGDIEKVATGLMTTPELLERYLESIHVLK